MATHSSILAWRIPWTEEPGGLQRVHGGARVVYDGATEANSRALKSQLRVDTLGLPRWLSGTESVCQRRSRGFDPWSAEQLSLWPTTPEPVLQSPQVTTMEAHRPRARVPQREKPAQGDTQAAWLESGPWSLQLEKGPRGNEDQAQLKNKHVKFLGEELLFSRSVILCATPWTAAPRPPCPSPSPRVYPDSCPSSRWCHPALSSSVVPFSSLLQSFSASESFQMSQLFASGGQSTKLSASASVLPMNDQDWFPLGRTGWISFQSKGLSRVFSNTTVQEHQSFSAQLSLWSNSHIYWKNHSLD